MDSQWQTTHSISDAKRWNIFGCLNQYMCKEVKLWNCQAREALKVLMAPWRLCGGYAYHVVVQQEIWTLS